MPCLTKYPGKPFVIMVNLKYPVAIPVYLDNYIEPFDYLMEAATLYIEKIYNKTGSIIDPVLHVWIPSKKKTYLYNSYFVLMNAGHYWMAELLRDKFKYQTNIDLSKEAMVESTNKISH